MIDEEIEWNSNKSDIELSRVIDRFNGGILNDDADWFYSRPNQIFRLRKPSDEELEELKSYLTSDPCKLKSHWIDDPKEECDYVILVTQVNPGIRFRYLLRALKGSDIPESPEEKYVGEYLLSNEYHRSNWTAIAVDLFSKANLYRHTFIFDEENAVYHLVDVLLNSFRRNLMMLNIQGKFGITDRMFFDSNPDRKFRVRKPQDGELSDCGIPEEHQLRNFYILAVFVKEVRDGGQYRIRIPIIHDKRIPENVGDGWVKKRLIPLLPEEAKERMRTLGVKIT